MAFRLIWIALVLLAAAPASGQEPDREIEFGGGWYNFNPLRIEDFNQWSAPSVNLAWTTWYSERAGWTVGAMPVLGGYRNQRAVFGHFTWRRRWLQNGKGNFLHLGLGAGSMVSKYVYSYSPRETRLWIYFLWHVEVLATRRIRDGLALRAGVTFTPLLHLPIAAQPLVMIVWKY